MSGEVTYHQQVVFCGQTRCRRCREGTGHGPYWYAYRTVNGRTTRTYLGKHLPPSIEQQLPPVKEGQETLLLRVWLLGGLRLERRASTRHAFERVPELPWQAAPKARTLLAYLLSCPARRASLRQIREALWPQTVHDEAQARLTHTLEVLCGVVAQARKRRMMTPLVEVEGDWVQLSDQSQIWVDADAFEAAYATVMQQIAEDDGGPLQQKSGLADLRLWREQTLACYGGEFFPEERDAEWANQRRHLLHRHYTTVALDLADDYLAHGEAQKASDLLDRLLSTDPTNEAATQRLMIALAQQSRRLEALRLYQRFVAALHRSASLSPQKETERLHEQIRRGAPVSMLPKRTYQASCPHEIQAVRPRLRAIGRWHQGPFIGREEEWHRLQSLLACGELPFQEEPHVLLIRGEAGLGKTRLMEEAAHEAVSHGWTVAWGRAYPQESGIPYRLWMEALRPIVTEERWPREELGRRPLVFQPLLALLPELESLLPQIAFPVALSPEQEQLRLWEAARELLILIAEGKPLLIALDDLHWADSSSCELLGYLARRVAGQPVVIIGTCRENELPDNHPLHPLLTDLQRERVVESVALQRLSDEQINLLVSSMPGLSERITRRIRARAAGNPYFAEELAKSARAQIMAESSPDTLDLDALLPETISAVLDLRLSRLSIACRRLLATASVLGGSFTLQVINEVEADALASNEDRVLDLLEEALRSGILTEEGVGTRITYRFWHPLLASHLYEQLSAARRAQLHRRAADILRRANPRPEEEREHAATITHHLMHGGAEDALIVHYAELAGDHAYGLSSYPDAERYYKIALERLSDTTEERLHRAELLERLGECTRVQGKYEEARNIYERVLSARSHFATSDPSQEAQIQTMLWCELGLAWYGMDHIAQAQECYQHGEQILQAAGVTAGPAMARVRYEQSYCSWRKGDYEGAQQLAQEALRQFEQAIVGDDSQDRNSLCTRLGRSLAGDPVDLGRTRMLLGMIAGAAGRTSEALHSFEEARILFERLDCRRELAILCCNMGDLYLRQAVYDRAQAALRECLHLAERIGERPLSAFALGNLGILALSRGQPQEAALHCRQALTYVSDVSSVCLWTVHLASALREEGKFEEASAQLLRALQFARRLRLPHHRSVALLCLAALRLAQAKQIGSDQAKQQQCLRRVQRTAHTVLRIEGSELQERIEARLILAQALSLLGEKQAAQSEADQALREAGAGGFAELADRLHSFLDQIRQPGAH